MGSIFERPGLHYISHRGFRPLAPDNSLPGFEYAGLLRQWAIETDVQKTKDGVLVCCHDGTVDATYNGTGAIQDMSWKELQQLRMNVGSRVECFTEEQKRMPLFSEYLVICKRFGSVPFIELKTDDVQPVIQAVRDAGFEDEEVVMSSTVLSRLEETRKHTSKMFVHWIFAQEEQLHRIVKLGNAGISWFISDVSDCPPEKIQCTREMGLKVCLRAGDSITSVKQMIAMGLDYIPTNCMHMSL